MVSIHTDFAHDQLGWLIDVPLFIDEQRGEQLYDVTVQPVFEEYQETAAEREETDSEDETKQYGGSIKVGMKGASLLGLITGGFASGQVDASRSSTDGSEIGMRYQLTQTPQRQLAQICLEYLSNDIYEFNENGENTDDESGDERPTNGTESSEMGEVSIERDYSLITNRAEFEWEDIAREISSPRDLIALRLPGAKEIYDNGNNMNTIIIPTAAEFDDGSVVPIYTELGTDERDLPKYPQRDHVWGALGDYYENLVEEHPSGEVIGENVQLARKRYWHWFQQKFDPKNTTRTIEDVVADNGDIRWIDFRLPLDDTGQTLHLHIQGREQYSTGTFAYNFVKRGYKHGLTIVGTLKSEPDMDVLAIYER